mmetsp:Transcript_3886/g.10653  ORF Transcript_3886/g.10653 Transcript_3886/m.10653 type:complete len:249 (-) Transcript_3886:68-814(-)
MRVQREVDRDPGRLRGPAFQPGGRQEDRVPHPQHPRRPGAQTIAVWGLAGHGRDSDDQQVGVRRRHREVRRRGHPGHGDLRDLRRLEARGLGAHRRAVAGEHQRGGEGLRLGDGQRQVLPQGLRGEPPGPCHPGVRRRRRRGERRLAPPRGTLRRRAATLSPRSDGLACAALWRTTLGAEHDLLRASAPATELGRLVGGVVGPRPTRGVPLAEIARGASPCATALGVRALVVARSCARPFVKARRRAG